MENKIEKRDESGMTLSKCGITSYELEDGDGVELHDTFYSETDIKDFLRRIKEYVVKFDHQGPLGAQGYISEREFVNFLNHIDKLAGNSFALVSGDEQ